MLVPDQIIPEYGSYLRIERAMSDNTVSSYLSDITSFFGSTGLDPETVAPDDIITYFASRSGISERTQARILSALRSFFNYLMLEGYISHNPADKVDTKTLMDSKAVKEDIRILMDSKAVKVVIKTLMLSLLHRILMLSKVVSSNMDMEFNYLLYLRMLRTL